MLIKDNCPCGSGLLYSECCEPIIKNIKVASTAESLMRSRYSAYDKVEIEYLIETTYPTKRSLHKFESIKEWSENSRWEKLEVLSTKDGGVNDEVGQVEFIAHYNEHGIKRSHHELSYFKKENGKWFFEYGETPKKVELVAKVGRNDPCTCGSGKKYKKCCLRA